MATKFQTAFPLEPAYEADASAWALRQAELLRARRFDALDIDNLSEEIESLPKTDYRALGSAIEIVLLHMAKWDAQPSHRSKSWAVSIANHRDHAEEELESSPSLRGRLDGAIASAWRRARRSASAETDLPLKRFAVDCPYSWEAIANRPFEWPENAD